MCRTEGTWEGRGRIRHEVSGGSVRAAHHHEVEDNEVHVEMTLTAQGCGMGPYIAQQAEWAISELDDVEDVNCNFGVSNFDFRFTAANATLMSAKYKAEQNILHLTAALSDNSKSI